jgi:ABC-type hemin transport system ATPase subunit
MLISHDYNLVHHYASRVVLMADGRIRVDGHIAKFDPNSKQV